MADMIRAGITGVLMTLTLFGSFEMGYGGGERRREYLQRRDIPVAVENRSALFEFLRRTGQEGIPEECTVTLDPAWADPTDYRSYAMDCPDGIRADG